MYGKKEKHWDDNKWTDDCMLWNDITEYDMWWNIVKTHVTDICRRINIDIWEAL